MIRVGILGATGYAGSELVRLLSQHGGVTLTLLSSKSYEGQKMSDVYPAMRNVCDLTLTAPDPAVAAEKCDVVFTALPHGASKEIIPKLYALGLTVIDLSGDYRYNDPSVYEMWYQQPHSSPELLAESVYGLPELHREEIKKTRLVGNPGCYTTCSILGLAPLLAAGVVEPTNIIIDAKSGVSGAGRGLSVDYHFCECTENMKAYKVATHRHTSEIEQELSLLAKTDIKLSFTPHLVPMKRGIYATMYANLKAPATKESLLKLYHEFYDKEKFVRIYDEGLPESNHVAGSNFVDIGLCVDERLNRVIVVGAIDNLIKGAAGQAVQNMNLICGLPEEQGLCGAGFYL
ncbi:MAG: N-acetyl-gamma-glutamyl-phosphate reductase [Ruminococcaceae bacterium]|nr:N-acetyl-gamma-glutamyl-phosphate reductase [Oscillospiraceae bacterium]